jgi:hypothetical protein
MDTGETAPESLGNTPPLLCRYGGRPSSREAPLLSSIPLILHHLKGIKTTSAAHGALSPASGAFGGTVGPSYALSGQYRAIVLSIVRHRQSPNVCNYQFEANNTVEEHVKPKSTGTADGFISLHNVPVDSVVYEVKRVSQEDHQ